MCQRCNDPNCTSSIVKLSGGTQSELCIDCLNDWHGLMQSSAFLPRRLAFVVLLNVLQAREGAGQVPTADEYLDFLTEECGMNNELFAAGLMFCAEKIVRNNPTDSDV